MNVLLVTDAYPPMRTSGAAQMFDLGQAFINEGIHVLVIYPRSNQASSLEIIRLSGCTVFSVRAFQTKDVAYWRRTLAELINPFLMWFKLKNSPIFRAQKIHGIIWYSPTIFWGPLIKRLKQYFQCPSYLIQRDFFPDWAVDVGLMKKGLAYHFFKMVEKFQFQQADKIGVQSPNNQSYLNHQYPALSSKVEVLWNWLGNAERVASSIDIKNTKLAGRTILIYAGNMGVAQGMEDLIQLIHALRGRTDLGFVLVGRGSEVSRIRSFVNEQKVSNILIFDEIPSSQINSLFEQCHIGLLSLDMRHQAHNIPGKFIAYMHSGLPVFGFVNPGNDLQSMVYLRNIGTLLDHRDITQATHHLDLLIHLTKQDSHINLRCKNLAQELFSASSATKQILKSFIDGH